MFLWIFLEALAMAFWWIHFRCESGSPVLLFLDLLVFQEEPILITWMNAADLKVDGRLGRPYCEIDFCCL